MPLPLSGPLCGHCLGRLRPAFLEPLCRLCGARWEGPEPCCFRCRGGLRAVDAVRAAFLYREPLPPMLYAFKYAGRLSVGRVLGDWMAGSLRRYSELRGVDALIPVPLHPAKERERGFNQARYLADRVGRACGIPVLDVLARRRNTAAQWRFRRGERERRLLSAFHIASGSSLAGLDLLLIDDVCTSGGTLEGCARALRSAGAASVRAFVLARS